MGYKQGDVLMIDEIIENKQILVLVEFRYYDKFLGKQAYAEVKVMKHIQPYPYDDHLRLGYLIPSKTLRLLTKAEKVLYAK